jgi:serine/threonine protein kinase/Flp pilus assembly protein TadD
VNERSLFLAALDIVDPAKRAAYLDKACAGNAALREHLERLLRMHDQIGCFLEAPLPGAASGSPEQTGAYAPSAQVGQVIAGRYKLLEEIGEGGMGSVWVAEQIQPVRRKVALKLIKAGMDSKSVLARFEAERQALAMMDHPNVAKVLDGGLTETGRPFFVMEYVKGVPITEYCDATRLSVPERLALFVQVCQAVQHAHQKGIIHRDLKPSNILVAPYDDKPVPKIIDFGLAKAMHQSLTERTLHTAHESVLGTPLYMSPEQAQLNNLDVDTRSDIYSLGVLLYELLTGTTPLERQRFKEAAWDEIRRLIREEEPPRPSTRLSSTNTLPSLAACRQTEPAKLTKQVRGELDWIVMKALEKDRSRRYDTANGFALDVQRYLAGEPVLAAPPSASYRLRKFARKNRAALTSAAVIALLLLAGLGLVTWMWQAERAARADADLARRDAEAKAEEILEGAERMNEANAAMRVAEQSAMLGEWAAAEAAHNRAIDLRRDHSEAWMRRAELYAILGLWDLALRDYAQSFDLRTPDQVGPWLQYAVLYLQQGDEAGYRRVCQRMRERFGQANDPFTWSWLIRACSLVPDTVPGHDRPAYLPSLANAPPGVAWLAQYVLGLAYFRAGRYPEAVWNLRESLAKTNYPARAMNYPVLAMALHRSGELGAARQELENSRKALDHWTQVALDSRDQLGPGSWFGGKHWVDWLEFLVYHREARRLIEQASPPEDARLRFLRGRAFAALGRQDRADAEYAAALRLAPNDPQIRKAVETANAAAKPAVVVHLEALGDSHALSGAWSEALSAYNQAADLDPGNHVYLYYVAALRLRAGDMMGYRRACATMLERFGDTDQPDIAERVAKTCLLVPDAVSDFDRVLKLADRAVKGNEEHPWYQYFVFVKALAEYRAGHHAEAVKWLEQFGPKAIGGNMDAYVFAVLSMAQHRLGRGEAARVALASAEKIVAKKLPDPAAGRPFGGGWHDWLRCQALLREAKEQVKKEPEFRNRQSRKEAP